MPEDFYTSPEWLSVRDLVLERDGNACLLRRFVGGRCSGSLHVHHIEPRADRPDLELDPENLVTCCAGHHPSVEAFRRLVERLRSPGCVPLDCNHRHPYRQGRIECYRRRLRAAGVVADDRDLAAVA